MEQKGMGGGGPGSTRSLIGSPSARAYCRKDSEVFEGSLGTSPSAADRFHLVAAKVVQGCEGISSKRSFCHENSGCARRCSAALKFTPQAWPAEAISFRSAAIAASVALFCTAPAMA